MGLNNVSNVKHRDINMYVHLPPVLMLHQQLTSADKACSGMNYTAQDHACTVQHACIQTSRSAGRFIFIFTKSGEDSEMLEPEAGLIACNFRMCSAPAGKRHI